MYATKRRRRSVKGNNKTISPKELPCSTNAPSSVLKTNPSKRHRERLNGELERCAGLLPFDPNIISKLDKLSILRLSVSYLRIKSYFQVLQLREHAFNYDQAAVHHQHHPLKHTAGHTFPLDPSLTHTDSVLEALNGFIMVVTCNDGEIFFASSSAETFLGFHQSDLIHYSLAEFIHSEDRPELIKQLSFPPVSPQENIPVLERCFSVRFRCLLDNTSGFLRMEIRGRIGNLHGQTCHTAGERQLGLIAICSPYGPPALLDNTPRDAGFKSKHKMDLSLISLDSKGKALVGYEDDGTPLASRNFYNWIHPDDLNFVASAHRTLVKHGSSNLLAYRIANKALQWQWLQSTFKTIFKSGKPDHIVGTHQPLNEEEARDRVPKRDSATRDLDLDTRDLLPDEPPSRPPKPKKRSSPTTSLAFTPQPSQRRRKSFSADITPRPPDPTASALYPAFPMATDGSLSGSLSYCSNAYSLLDSARLFGSESLLPYGNYGSGFYSGLEGMPSTGGGVLDAGRGYEFYTAGAYNDVMPSSGDYLKSYYKTMDVFPASTASSYPCSSMNGYDPHASATTATVPYHLTSKPPSWMSHHRQSVVVWNNNTRSQVDALKSNGTSAWTASATNGSAYSLLPNGGFSGNNGEMETGVKYASSGRHHRDDKTHLNILGVDKPLAIPAVNFSIAEATNTLLDTAG